MSLAYNRSIFDFEPDFKSQNLYLPKRDFIQKLSYHAKKQCNNILNTNKELNSFNSEKSCQREFMIAGACVLLKKSNIHFGDARDAMYDCRHEIELSQNSLLNSFGDFPLEKMDKWLLGLQRSIRPFI